MGKSKKKTNVDTLVNRFGAAPQPDEVTGSVMTIDDLSSEDITHLKAAFHAIRDHITVYVDGFGTHVTAQAFNAYLKSEFGDREFIEKPSAAGATKKRLSEHQEDDVEEEEEDKSTPTGAGHGADGHKRVKVGSATAGPATARPSNDTAVGTTTAANTTQEPESASKRRKAGKR